MTTEEEVFRTIRGFYKPNGFDVKRIERDPSEKRPDAEIRGFDELALVEIKIKGDAEEEEAKRLLAFENNEVYFRQSPIVPGNTHAGVARDAARQLNAILKDGPHFRIAWISFAGPAANSSRTRFRSTLYGIRRLADLQNGTGYDCHDFNDSSFFRLKEELDAVVLESGEELQLCLNDFSPRYERFEASRIARVLRAGINDPVVLERTGAILRVDSVTDRTSDETKLASLQRKYGLPALQLLDLTETMVEICIPDSARGP
jgi:hypothetical protein